MGERKVRPNKDQIFSCPRCHSTNTKFCYYNNYSLTQPRYLCKACKRYWTQGGSLRNVPIGGGSRKNKKSNSPQFLPQNPWTQQGQGHHNVVSQFLEMPKIENNISNQHNSCFASSSVQISAPGVLGGSGIATRDMNPCVQTGGTFCFQELKPTLGFGNQENGGRVMLSFGQLYNQLSSSEGDQNKGQGNSSGYWNGMFGGGSW